MRILTDLDNGIPLNGGRWSPLWRDPFTGKWTTVCLACATERTVSLYPPPASAEDFKDQMEKSLFCRCSPCAS